MKSIAALLAAALVVGVAGGGAAASAPRLVVLGVDGLDPVLVEEGIRRGELPNLAALADGERVTRLGTTMPPLSPIAWSTFITGMDPGGHGIFDFIHRDPATMRPYLSMSRAESPPELALGTWTLPLPGGGVENLRKGRAFWQILDEHGVPATVFRIPANFPPAPTRARTLSGMGTPDVRGTPGTFTFFADHAVPGAKDFTGGEAVRVEVVEGRVRAELEGPPNPFRRVARDGRWKHPAMKIPFDVWIDADDDAVRIDLPDRKVVLREGEWSAWTPVLFQPLPAAGGVSALARFYLKSVRPDFELYVTPLQIDPADPGAMTLSTPDDWSHELCEELGYFYTQELPQDTKALTHGVFTPAEFLDQAEIVFGESRRALDALTRDHRAGLLFFYFSTIDQGSHMLWRHRDPSHPAHVPGDGLDDAIPELYRKIDGVVGRARASVGEGTPFVVMSDHGFAPFRRQVNLNTWLLDEGFIALRDPSRQGRGVFFSNVDWSRTRAYALGLNGVYVNLLGREKNGIVAPEERDAVIDDIAARLAALRDPESGDRAVTRTVVPSREFSGPHRNDGPDLLVGYARGYRSSWRSPLGEFPRGVFADNTDPWSGDHAMDPDFVPGVLLTNLDVTCDDPSLADLTVSILDAWDVAPVPGMTGRDCLSNTPKGGS